MSFEPSMHSLERRIDQTDKRVYDLDREVNGHYVRKEHYRDNHRNLTQRVEKIETGLAAEKDAREGMRRQVIVVVLGGVIMVLFNVALGITQVSGG